MQMCDESGCNMGLSLHLHYDMDNERQGGASTMADTKYNVPIWHKTNLTVEEAAAYCGVGSKKLREMSDSEYCPFVLWNGNKRLFKRKKLDEYLADMYSI